MIALPRGDAGTATEDDSDVMVGKEDIFLSCFRTFSISHCISVLSALHSPSSSQL